MAKQSTHHCCRSLLAAQLAHNTASGPTIAFTLSSGSVNGGYVFSQVGNTPLGPAVLVWTQVGGDPDTDFVAVDSGIAYVWSGGVERYLSFNHGADPLLPQDYTDWTLGAGGANPTPTFS